MFSTLNNNTFFEKKYLPLYISQRSYKLKVICKHSSKYLNIVYYAVATTFRYKHYSKLQVVAESYVKNAMKVSFIGYKATSPNECLNGHL